MTNSGLVILLPLAVLAVMALSVFSPFVWSAAARSIGSLMKDKSRRRRAKR